MAKKSLIKILIPIVIIGILFGFAPSIFRRFAEIKKFKDEARQKELCEKTGGTIQLGGFNGRPLCVHQYSDGGKPCNSSEECGGVCEVKRDGTNPHCKRDDMPYGCHLSIEDFRAGKNMVCID